MVGSLNLICDDIVAMHTYTEQKGQLSSAVAAIHLCRRWVASWFGYWVHLSDDARQGKICGDPGLPSLQCPPLDLPSMIQRNASRTFSRKSC